jgi:hypothetical protein
VSACAAGVGLDRLVDYWIDRAAAFDELLEEHVFACAACTTRLEWLAAIAETMPSVLEQRGGRRLVLTGDTVEHLERRGVRLRQYHFDDARRIECTVGFDDDLVVSWIPLEVADDETVSGIMRAPDGSEFSRLDDAPVDRARGALILASAAETLLRLPDIELRLQLSATGPRGTRELGELVYNHSAPRPAS